MLQQNNIGKLPQLQMFSDCPLYILMVSILLFSCSGRIMTKLDFGTRETNFDLTTLGSRSFTISLNKYRLRFCIGGGLWNLSPIVYILIAHYGQYEQEELLWQQKRVNMCT